MALKKKEKTRRRLISFSQEMSDRIDSYLEDPRTGRPIYGSISWLVEQALNAYFANEEESIPEERKVLDNE